MSWIWHNKRQPVVEPEWGEPVLPLQAAYQQYLTAWEERCRGYEVCPYPVALEPPFAPLASDPIYGAQALEELFAFPCREQGNRAFAALRLPVEQKVTPPLSEALLTSLLRPGATVSFEIIASGEDIVYQWTHEGSEAEHLASTLQLHCHLADVEPSPDLLHTMLIELAECPVGYQVVDFGLYQPVYQPLKYFKSFNLLDPQGALIAALSQLQPGEVAGLQVLFAPATQPWAESITQLVAAFKQPRARYESSLERRAQAKLSSPLTACVVRVFAASAINDRAIDSSATNGSPGGDARAFSLCQRLGSALSALSETGSNELVALDNSDYDEAEHFAGLLHRTSYRQGMLLSVAELSGLVHPPTEKLQHPRLLRLDPTQRPLPEHLRADGATMGKHTYRNREQAVVWPDAYRTRHAYILGATRMGKSTLLLNLMQQDIEQGRGLCVIDPHGDLAKDVLSLIPVSRAADTLYLDLSDRDYPVAMGLLEAGDEWEKRLLVSDLLAILRRLFAASWGDRLEHILRHVLVTLLQHAGPGGSSHTLRDIRPLLTDTAYREQVLHGLTDPDLQAFWRSEFPGYSPATLSPIYNKLGILLGSPLVRNIVAQPQSRLPMAQLMAEGKIVIVNLAQSLIGEDNAHFLGALLVSKIQIAAMQSLRQSRGSRTPFTLYVDEFQNFVVSSFEKILSEAGKVELSLVMANQFLEQLNSHLQTAILSNVGTLVSFRVSSDSARHLEPEFGRLFSPATLVDLGRGEAILRLGQAGDSFRIHTLPPPDKQRDSQGHQVIEQTRASCCRPRAEVEAGLFPDRVEPDPNNTGAPSGDDDPDDGSGAARHKASNAAPNSSSQRKSSPRRSKRTTPAKPASPQHSAQVDDIATAADDDFGDLGDSGTTEQTDTIMGTGSKVNVASSTHIGTVDTTSAGRSDVGSTEAAAAAHDTPAGRNTPAAHGGADDTATDAVRAQPPVHPSAAEPEMFGLIED